MRIADPLPLSRHCVPIDSKAKFLPRLEVGHKLFLHTDGFSGSRVASDSSVSCSGGKGAETSQFDPVSAFKGGGNLVKDRGNDEFDISQKQMRVLVSQSEYQLRPCHASAYFRPCLNSSMTGKPGWLTLDPLSDRVQETFLRPVGVRKPDAATSKAVPASSRDHEKLRQSPQSVRIFPLRARHVRTSS